jgi:putative competence protein
MLLILGNFLRLFVEDRNVPKIEISEEVSYKKDKAKKENDLSGTNTKYDVNSVTYEELLKLNFGKSKAQKIIEFRDEMGIIFEMDELKGIPKFGESGLKLAKKYLYVDSEKLKNVEENYKKSSFKKYNITKSDEEELKKIGFTKKEIKKILPEIENKNIHSNIDLERLVGNSRYLELEKRIKFLDE